MRESNKMKAGSARCWYKTWRFLTQLPTLWFGVRYRKYLRTKREGQGRGERAGGSKGRREGAGRTDAHTRTNGSYCGNGLREELRDATWRTGLRPLLPQLREGGGGKCMGEADEQ